MRKNILIKAVNKRNCLSKIKTSAIFNIRIVTLCLVLCLVVSFANVSFISQFGNRASALTYQQSTNLEFTFNSTISLTVSGDLNIEELTPGDSSDSNIIDINVATNNVLGYTLSATAGNISNASTDLKRSDNVNNKFTSLATNDSYTSFDDDNIAPNTWGYSYSSNSGSTWSNYSGLPLYTSTNGKELVYTNTNTDNPSIKFKIAAKASNTQVSGAYTNTINFTALANPIPPKTMQDVDTWKSELANIGDETEAVDTRDGNVYSVARLCTSYTGDTCTESQIWMTKNLDLIVGPAGVGNLTSKDSDINEDLSATMGYSTDGDTITWVPGSTLATPAIITEHNPGTTAGAVTGWVNATEPYQAEGDDYYIYTSGNNDTDIIYASIENCLDGNHTIEQCNHYHAGNYYNFNAAVAVNNTSSYIADLYVMPNSICPKGWRLPNGLADNDGTTIMSEFNKLALANGIVANSTTAHGSDDDRNIGIDWNANGFNNFRTSFLNSHGQQVPMYFVRAGSLNSTALNNYGTLGYLWSSTIRSRPWSYSLRFNSSNLSPANQPGRFTGYPVRCLAR